MYYDVKYAETHTISSEETVVVSGEDEREARLKAETIIKDDLDFYEIKNYSFEILSITPRKDRSYYMYEIEFTRQGETFYRPYFRYEEDESAEDSAGAAEEIYNRFTLSRFPIDEGSLKILNRTKISNGEYCLLVK